MRSALAYNSLVEEGLDLYRFEVREKMHLRTPRSYNDECVIWQKVGNFIFWGDSFGARDVLDYALGEDSSQAVKTEESTGNIQKTVIIHRLAPDLTRLLWIVALACGATALTILFRGLMSLWAAQQGGKARSRTAH